jgi:perosamine synthetase
VKSRYAQIVIKQIPVFRPGFGKEELDALAQVFKSGWLGPGPKAVEFEERFAASVGSPHAVSVTSCTAALHLTLLALGLGPGDEVLVPSLSFASTGHAALFCGCEVTFVDVEPVACTLDPDDLESKISPRSRVVIPVHYGGNPAQMDRIWEIAEANGLKVVEDAAHACGATYRGGRTGGHPRSAATCFSFNTLKNLSTGDGGMVTTHSGELSEKIRRLRWMGINKNTFERTSGAVQPDDETPLPRYEWYYEIAELGYKYIMNDIAASLGLVQLSKLNAMQARRREMALRYLRSLDGLEWLALPQERDYAESAWHLFAVRTAHRDGLRKHLQDQGIATSVHYYPLHLQPLYRRRHRVSLPVTEHLALELLTLPFHPNLDFDEIDRVVEAVRSFEACLLRSPGV